MSVPPPVGGSASRGSARLPVSVVLPTHDRRLPWLRQAVASVAAQTFARWELIVVDDGSRDGTASWVRSLDDPRIRLLRQEATHSPAAVRNHGIRAAVGVWIAFLDSDDGWEVDHLEACLGALAGDGAGWCYADCRLVDAQRRPVRGGADGIAQAPGGWILRDLLAFRARIATSAVLARRDLVDAVGAFDEAIRYGHDMDLWFRLALRAPAVVVARPTVWTRKHAQHEPDAIPKPRVYLDRIRSYDKLRAAAPTAGIRRLCRRRIARYAGTLSACHAHAGDPRNARAAALQSVGAWPLAARPWLMLGRALLVRQQASSAARLTPPPR